MNVIYDMSEDTRIREIARLRERAVLMYLKKMIG